MNNFGNFGSLNSDTLVEARSAIIIADAAGEDMPIVFLDPAFEALTGYAESEVLGRNCRFLQGTDRDQPGLQAIREGLKSGSPTGAILRNYRKDGHCFLNNIYITPVRSAGGDITHFIGCQNEVLDLADAVLWQNAMAGFNRLTTREQEVFTLIVNGHVNKSVARTLKISPRTAEKHRRAIQSKFDTSNLTLLVRYSIALGIPFEPPVA